MNHVNMNIVKNYFFFFLILLIIIGYKNIKSNDD